MVDSKKLKDSLVEFMSEHFGEVVGKRLLSMKLLEYKKFDFDDFSDYELKSFIAILIESLFGKIRTASQVKIIKLDLLNRIFGKEESIESMSPKSKNAIKPIKFVDELFGPQLGPAVLKTAQMEFNEPHIETQDELKQILFMKRVVEKLFNYDSELKDDVNIMMLTFLKNGKSSHSVIEEDVSKRTLHMFEDLLFWVREFNSQDLEEALKGVHNLNIDDSLRTDLDKLEVKIFNKKSEDGNEEVLTIEGFISNYLGIVEGHNFIDAEKEKFDVKDILALSDDNRHLFIDDFMHQGVLNEYSMQRKKYLVGKLLAFFGMI